MYTRAETKQKDRSTIEEADCNQQDEDDIKKSVHPEQSQINWSRALDRVSGWSSLSKQRGRRQSDAEENESSIEKPRERRKLFEN